MTENWTKNLSLDYPLVLEIISVRRPDEVALHVVDVALVVHQVVLVLSLYLNPPHHNIVLHVDTFFFAFILSLLREVIQELLLSWVKYLLVFLVVLLLLLLLKLLILLLLNIVIVRLFLIGRLLREIVLMTAMVLLLNWLVFRARALTVIEVSHLHQIIVVDSLSVTVLTTSVALSVLEVLRRRSTALMFAALIIKVNEIISVVLLRLRLDRGNWRLDSRPALTILLLRR